MAHALGTLIVFLFFVTPFRAVTYALELIVVLTIISPRRSLSVMNRAVPVGVFAVVTAVVAFLRTKLPGMLEDGGGNAALALQPARRAQR